MRNTRPRPRSRLLVALLLLLALVAGACGGDDGGSKTASKKKKTADLVAEETTTTTTALTTETSLAEATTTTAVTVAAAAAPALRPKAAPKAAPRQSAGIINVTATTSTVPAATIKRGGTVTYTTPAEAVSGFDPAVLASAAAQFRALYDTLLDVDIDNGDIIARTAESMTSTDGRTWTLKIRPNIKFSDGTDYNAEAVKFNWARIADPVNKSSSAALVNQMASYDVVDPLTLRIVLKAVNGQFPRTVVGIPYIGSPKALQEKGANFANEPVGAGPFTFKSWKRDDRLELERNATYWDQPKPYLDKVIIRQVVDVQQRLNSLKAGESELAVIQDPEAFDNATKTSSLKTALTVSAIGGRVFLLNHTKAPFDDVRARKALSLALDRSGFIKTVTKGLDDSTDNIIRPPSPFYDANTKMNPFNAAEAQKLFDQLAAEGNKVKFTLKPTATNAAMGEYFQAQLQQFRNLEVNVEVIPTSQISNVLVSGNFQALVSQIFSPDPDVYYNTFHSTGSGNFMKYKSAAMDAALDAGRAAFDVASRFASYKKFQELVRDDVPTIFISQNKAGLVGQKYVQGMKGWNAAGFPTPNWQDLWFDK